MTDSPHLDDAGTQNRQTNTQKRPTVLINRISHALPTSRPAPQSDPNPVRNRQTHTKNSHGREEQSGASCEFGVGNFFLRRKNPKPKKEKKEVLAELKRQERSIKMCEPELGMSEILLADTRRPTHNAKIVSKKTCKTMDDTKLHVYVLQAVEKRPIPVVGTSAVGTSAIPKTTPQSTTTNTSLDSDSDEDDSKPEQVKRPRLGEILVTYFKARQEEIDNLSLQSNLT